MLFVLGGSRGVAKRDVGHRKANGCVFFATIWVAFQRANRIEMSFCRKEWP